MVRLKCTVSYDGTHFAGYQIQPKRRTIQGDIEKAIATMHKGENIRIYSSGRTDAGVHAKGQVFHFDSTLSLSEQQWKKALNSLLPDDIYIHDVQFTNDDFHARFNATEKEYRYYILRSNTYDVFLRNYRYITRDNFDFHKMEEACRVIEGTHDFTAFSSARSTVKGSKVRTIYDFSFEVNGEELMFKIRGDGFLYHMVRILVSVVLDVGKGLVTARDIEEIFHRQDRGTIGPTLPPNGLFLWQVIYEK